MPSDITLSLEGKVALVTGGSRGIGAVTVRLFVRAGAKVVFNYRQAADEAEKLVAECGPSVCHAVHADLSGTATAESLVKATVERFGALDCVGRQSRHLARDRRRHRRNVGRAVAQHRCGESRQCLRAGKALGSADEAAAAGRPHRPGQLYRWSARRGRTRGLRCHQGRADQHGQRTLDRVGSLRHSRQLRSARMGGN